MAKDCYLILILSERGHENLLSKAQDPRGRKEETQLAQ
jgi:hypothetical protein